jgi:hypothetical protein
VESSTIVNCVLGYQGKAIDNFQVDEQIQGGGFVHIPGLRASSWEL